MIQDLYWRATTVAVLGDKRTTAGHYREIRWSSNWTQIFEIGPLPPPAPASRSTTTTFQNKYQLGRLLGWGSFAKVYQALSLADNTHVAIKVIHKDKSALKPPALEPQTFREVAAMRWLQSHPKILRIHQVMATRSWIYLVMEQATSGELFSRIVRRGRFTKPATRCYFQQLLSVLNYCHENRVVRRDVKPQNLLLDHMGNLKVTDFGLSVLPEQLRDGLLHTACGTPAFTAPEVRLWSLVNLSSTMSGQPCGS